MEALPGLVAREHCHQTNIHQGWQKAGPQNIEKNMNINFKIRILVCGVEPLSRWRHPRRTIIWDSSLRMGTGARSCFFEWNQTQYTAAWTIILWIWGRYWKKSGAVGKTADGDNVYGGGSGDNDGSGLCKKDTSKEEFTPAEVKFVEMLAINQGKGPAFIDWIGRGFQGDSNYPWAVDKQSIAIKQWLFVGEEAYNDPVTHGILYKLLFTSKGYNTHSIRDHGIQRKSCFCRPRKNRFKYGWCNNSR